MRFLVGLAPLLLPGCIIFDTSPGDQRLRELTDIDEDGSTLAEGDCNDADPLVYPGAPELCDGLDNDCDEATDEDGGDLSWCLDQDGDGHGDPSTMNNACVIPADGVATCDDCNDADHAVYPLADELCDGVDNNCDLVVDDLESVDAATWYRDVDGDGYGVSEPTTTACGVPEGYAALPGDCDDGEPAVNPGMVEVCDNGMDDDCDGTAGGCGFSGSEELEPHGVSGLDGGYIAGPDATAETLGQRVYITDVTADGSADIVLCGYGDMYGAHYGGSVHLWYGTPVGYQEISGAGASVYGPAGMYLGNVDNVLAADIDGDGGNDLLVGAVGAVAGFSDAGQVMAFQPGMSGTREVESSDTWVVGVAEGSYFGAGLQRADGLVGGGEYVLAGAYGYSELAEFGGRLYVVDLYAPDAAAPVLTISGTQPSDDVGGFEPPLIDLDGDGFDDIVFGAYERNGGEGSVLVFHGPLRGDYLLDDADTTISEPGSEGLGMGLTTLVDPDGAGFGRLIVTSAGVTDGDYDGAVYILASGLQGREVLSEVTEATVNGEVDDGGGLFHIDRGDLNGDGTEDLVVGDPMLDRSDASIAGAVYLIEDPLTLTGTHDIVEASQARFYGRSPGDQIGASLAVGDANHDGMNDLLFSGNNVDLTSRPGGAYFLLGEGL